MRDHGRATLARLSVERGWRRCAENEAAASAKRSEKPARLLAEEALAKCGEWKRLLRLALDNGAYPYLKGHVTKDDMIARAELESRDGRSEEHTSELQSLMRISYAVFCLEKKIQD